MVITTCSIIICIRYVVDLGLDAVHAFKFDEASGALSPLPPLQLKDGSHPRHIAFHPAGKYAVVITETDNTLVLLVHNAETGALTPTKFYEVSTLPPDFPSNGASATAEVIFSPDGHFVYASNRGQKGAPSSMTSFRLVESEEDGDAAGASLVYVGAATTATAQITSPRGVGLSADGKVRVLRNTIPQLTYFFFFKMTLIGCRASPVYTVDPHHAPPTSVSSLLTTCAHFRRCLVA